MTGVSVAEHLVAGSGVDADLARLLSLTRTHLGMEVAWISAFVDGQQVIVAASGNTTAMNVSVGQRLDAAGSYCTRVLTGVLAPAVADARHHLVTRDLPVTAELNIGSYAGAPWHQPDGHPAGMICCLSRHHDPRVDERAPRFLAFVADVLSAHLSSAVLTDRHERHHTATTVDTVLRARALQPVFQPIMRLHDAAIVAVEALARFHPDTFSAPDQAFGAAARCGRGVELELLAVEQALPYADRLTAGAWLGINLSAEALLDPRVQRLVLAHADRRIGVEVTEHTAVTDYPALTTVTRRLQDAGIHIAVDDAGAGYAGLNHILQLRPDTIKLDISLVRDIDTDSAKQALTRSMVTFAADIGAGLVAEGIETPAEHRTLHSLGVGYGQGYLLARPGPLPTEPAAG